MILIHIDYDAMLECPTKEYALSFCDVNIAYLMVPCTKVFDIAKVIFGVEPIEESMMETHLSWFAECLF